MLWALHELHKKPGQILRVQCCRVWLHAEPSAPSAWGRQPMAAPAVFRDGSLAFPQLGAEVANQPVADEEDAEANEEDDAELQAALQVSSRHSLATQAQGLRSNVALKLDLWRGSAQAWPEICPSVTAKTGCRCPHPSGVLRRQASLEVTARPVGLARDRPVAGAADVAMPGLRNETGEYNCFLNVIIQCLWHCTGFRAAIMALPPGMLKGAACHSLLKTSHVALSA